MELFSSLLPVLVGVLLVFGLLGAVTMTFSKSVSGISSLNENVTITDAIGLIANTTVPAAQPATLTVRTDGVTGSLTMTNANHGIVTGQRIDLYWNGGQCYGATVGTVSGTTVPFATVSGGSALPTAGTAITVGIATVVPCNFVGNNLSAIAVSGGTGQSGYAVFNNGSSDVYAFFLTSGFVPDWKTGSPVTNPFAGATPTRVYFSHNNTAAAVAGMTVNVLAH